MRKITSWLAMALLLICFIAGCGEKVTVVKKGGEPAKKECGLLTFVSQTEQTLKFSVDENGNIRNLRDGGIEVKPSDVEYVVYVSYRFGDYKTSPFKSTLSVSGEANFQLLPNNDQWAEYWVVLKSGKKFMVELSQFEVSELKGFYYWINPAESDLEYGDIESDAAQDWMRMKLNEETMTATLRGQFGCNLLFGTKAGVVNFQQGMLMVMEDGNGNTYSGNIIQNASGNISYEVQGLPVVAGPYAYGDYPGPTATTITNVYILLPNGEKITMNLFNNTIDNEDGSVYVWYIDAYADNENLKGDFGIAQSDNPMVVEYYPPQSN
jgi:hypothetical protein